MVLGCWWPETTSHILCYQQGSRSIFQGLWGAADLDAALELLLGASEHLHIQEEPETVVHRAETRALGSWGPTRHG